jgi:DNA-binding NarL/FixJ family response regulator
MPGDAPLSVVLQHRNRLFREMLGAHVTRDRALLLAGSVVSGPELVQLCNLQRPAVVVYEADAPRWSNDRLIALLRSSRPDVRVIGVHESLPAANVVRAYQSGINALVRYASGLTALISAIKVPSQAVELARAARPGPGALTERETEVLYLLSAGYSADHAAWLMGITLHTLEHHKRQIFAKLGVHDQAHAAAVAVGLGLTGPARDAPAAAERVLSRSRSINVLVRGPTGSVVDAVRKALTQPDIMLVPEAQSGRPAPPVDADTVTVMILPDLEPDGWQYVRVRGALVIVVTEKTKRDQVAEAWARGAGVVPASRVADLLLTAVRAAGQGFLLVDAAHCRAILAPSQTVGATGSPSWLLALTPREREILTFIARGHSMKQTARVLGISVRTVENLQGNLFRKLRVHSRAAALAAARDLGLLDEMNGREQHLAEVDAVL